MAEPAKVKAKEAPLEEVSIERAIDRISLEQAIRDFEVANARVIDLTQRLIASEHKVVEGQKELDDLRVAFHHLQAEHNAMRASMAFRLAAKIWALRNAVRV